MRFKQKLRGLAKRAQKRLPKEEVIYVMSWVDPETRKPLYRMTPIPDGYIEEWFDDEGRVTKTRTHRKNSQIAQTDAESESAKSEDTV